MDNDLHRLAVGLAATLAALCPGCTAIEENRPAADVSGTVMGASAQTTVSWPTTPRPALTPSGQQRDSLQLQLRGAEGQAPASPSPHVAKPLNLDNAETSLRSVIEGGGAAGRPGDIDPTTPDPRPAASIRSTMAGTLEVPESPDQDHVQSAAAPADLPTLAPAERRDTIPGPPRRSTPGRPASSAPGATPAARSASKTKNAAAPAGDGLSAEQIRDYF